MNEPSRHSPAATPPEEALFPLFLRLAGRTVVVVGGGEVAERKVRDLLEARADVVIVAPTSTPGIRELALRGAARLEAREFTESDIESAWLVVAATDLPAVQQRIAKAADRARTFTIAVDDVAHASAYSGAVVRRPPFLIAISSSGAAPALTRLLREMLDQFLPEERWVSQARALRAKWKRDGVPMGSRFGELVRAFRARDD